MARWTTGLTTGGTPPGTTVADPDASTTTHYVPSPRLYVGHAPTTFQVRSRRRNDAPQYQVTTVTSRPYRPSRQTGSSLGHSHHSGRRWPRRCHRLPGAQPQVVRAPSLRRRVSVRTDNDSGNVGTGYFDLGNVLTPDWLRSVPASWTAYLRARHTCKAGWQGPTTAGNPDWPDRPLQSGSPWGSAPERTPTAVSLARLSATPVGAALPLSALGILACGAMGIVVVQRKKRTD